MSFSDKSPNLTSPPGRVMALDVGDARIGVALSDTLQITAQPLTTVERTKRGIKELLTLIETQKPVSIVIGLPKMLSGEVGEQGLKTSQFGDELQRKLTARNIDSRLIFWDERLTTVNAERLIQGTKLRNKNRRALLDQVSAMLILEAFLAAPSTEIAE